MLVTVLHDCYVLLSAVVARYLSAACFLSMSVATWCQVNRASSSKKYQHSSLAPPSKLGTKHSPRPGKSAKGICSGFADGTGGWIGGAGCCAGSCVVRGACCIGVLADAVGVVGAVACVAVLSCTALAVCWIPAKGGRTAWFGLVFGAVACVFVVAAIAC